MLHRSCLELADVTDIVHYEAFSADTHNLRILEPSTLYAMFMTSPLC